ncbi:TAXI family TRAP transporter solute-binding subunit [Methylobacterium planeticum]|uniref:TRAP transporter substrate-binding protein n=1 Tax=Methylobacterium planeticum TaxID=2615211 RepID=A0A6N6MSD2_9HYPH|nr:TAXI family TRAP transporter solute-binding subunit [Methylobacterium planeticum]KAB1072471.1 TRAP transporter substrate-binding protein [Methylobacterium planeticum]
MRRRAVTLLVVGLVILGSAAAAAVIHLLLGLLTLSIAVPANPEGRRAASALAQVFAAEHPRVRIRTAPVPDLAAAAASLDTRSSDLAIVRSDGAGQNSQTLAILRRDAVVFVAPAGRIDGVRALRGHAVGLLDGRPLDAKLLDLILQHYAVPPETVRRRVFTLEQLPEAVRRREVDVLFVVAPAASGAWLSLYAALRKGGEDRPRTFEIDEAAAIAKEQPVLETLDVPKGTFQGSLPSPGDDITTLSVSYRLAATAAMPDWLAGEITREVLTDKSRLAALDRDLAGIEAPDPDDKTQALPIHTGTAAYLSGNLPSLSDQMQNAVYWLGLVASGMASMGAAGAALYQRLRPRQPPTRVMRLLEIWLAVPDAEPRALDDLVAEADAIAAAAIRAEALGRAESTEMRLVTLLVSHVREAVRRCRMPAREHPQEREAASATAR